VALPLSAGDAEYVDRFATKLAQYESYIESLVPSGRGGRKRGAALLQQQEALIPLDDVQVRKVLDMCSVRVLGCLLTTVDCIQPHLHP
jgi:hypothetical protein